MHKSNVMIMRKDFLIVDWLLLITFVFMVISKLVEMPAFKFVQPLFMVLIVIHLAQHWKIMAASLK